MFIDSWQDDVTEQIPHMQRFRARTDSSSTEPLLVSNTISQTSKKSSFYKNSASPKRKVLKKQSFIIIEEEEMKGQVQTDHKLQEDLQFNEFPEEEKDKIEMEEQSNKEDENKTDAQLHQEELKELITIQEQINNLSELMSLLTTIQMEQQSSVCVQEETLVREQKRQIRLQKIQRYREKRNARKWDFLRYEVRKKIAKTRLRHQGRFTRE